MIINRKLKTQRRVRRKIIGTRQMPRLSVFRSNKYIYAQLIDDEKQETLMSITDKSLEKEKSSKFERSKKLGVLLAKEAVAKKIKKVVFDRGRYIYKGRVRALAEGAREGGLVF